MKRHIPSPLTHVLSFAQVTWLRKRDAHVLTVGLFSYTSDQRFTPLHSEGSPDWVLKITSPQKRDSGIYECQVSTEPKISRAFNLSVVGEFLQLEISLVPKFLSSCVSPPFLDYFWQGLVGVSQGFKSVSMFLLSV